MQSFIVLAATFAGLLISASAIAVPNPVAAAESADLPFGLIPYPFAFTPMNSNNVSIIPSDWQTTDPEILALAKTGKDFDIADATYSQAREGDVETCACPSTISPVSSVLSKRTQHSPVCWHWCCDAHSVRVNDGIRYLRTLGSLCTETGTKTRISCSWSAGIFLENASGGRRCTNGNEVADHVQEITNRCQRSSTLGYYYTNGYIWINNNPAGFWAVVHASDC